MAIIFNRHNVTNGRDKARVTYSAFKMVSTGEDCVTIYAKDFQSGRALDQIFADGYENHTDSQTDYFEKGRVRIRADHDLYPAAYACAAMNGNA